MRMVARGHCRAAHGWADTQVALAPGLTEFDIVMLQIAYLANRRIAHLAHQADFTGRQAHLCVIAFLRQ